MNGFRASPQLGIKARMEVSPQLWGLLFAQENQDDVPLPQGPELTGTSYFPSSGYGGTYPYVLTICLFPPYSRHHDFYTTAFAPLSLLKGR